MLAAGCKSIKHQMKKCPNGMFSEIKYHGERVQVHKKGDHFSHFSHRLKPVLLPKVAHFKDYIPQPFCGSHGMILDSEVFLNDTRQPNHCPLGLGECTRKLPSRMLMSASLFLIISTLMSA